VKQNNNNSEGVDSNEQGTSNVKRHLIQNRPNVIAMHWWW